VISFIARNSTALHYSALNCSLYLALQQCTCSVTYLHLLREVSVESSEQDATHQDHYLALRVEGAIGGGEEQKRIKGG
jgi:hypothetical protein